jgi:hypothetical protein
MFHQEDKVFKVEILLFEIARNHLKGVNPMIPLLVHQPREETLDVLAF